MNFLYFLVYLLTLISYSKAYIDYCSSKICNNTKSHTYCKYLKGPGTSCIGYMDIPLSAEEKYRLIGRLNQRRNEVAGGLLRNFPTAANMLKMRWVEELARTAQRWADQCRPPAALDEKDDCRDLYSISVGQCVASIVGEAPGLRPESLLDTWYMQSLHFKGNYTNYIASSNIKRPYGDFAQIIWANAHMVGCGRSRFMAPVRGRLRTLERLVCNFAPRGPPHGALLWIPGPPSTRCPQRTARDGTYTNLCAYRGTDAYEKNSTIGLYDDANKQTEHYKPQTKMSPKEYLLWQALNDLENNESMNNEGSLDELYLKMLATATVASSNDKFYESTSMQDKIKGIDIETVSSSNFTITARKKLNKPKLIGRPKTYNIEELNEQLENIIANNNSHINENIDIDLYKEDDNTGERTSRPVKTIPKDIYESMQNIEKDELNTNEIVFDNKIINESLIPRYDANTTNKKIAGNLGIDYLLDTETDEELQDVLNRIEKALSYTKPTIAKVRREVRETTSRLEPVREQTHAARPSRVVNSTVQPTLSPLYRFPEYSAQTDNVSEGRNSSDRSPLISMVMKYMPILRQYENTLTGGNNKNEAPVILYVLTIAFYI